VARESSVVGRVAKSAALFASASALAFLAGDTPLARPGIDRCIPMKRLGCAPARWAAAAAPWCEVRLALNRRDGEAVVEIDDDGPGIAGEARERVFEPFYREPSRAPPAGPRPRARAGAARGRESRRQRALRGQTEPRRAPADPAPRGAGLS
jgi:hypothetical protein